MSMHVDDIEWGDNFSESNVASVNRFIFVFFLWYTSARSPNLFTVVILHHIDSMIDSITMASTN